jgi:hypothetical protein
MSLRALMVLVALVASGLAWETNKARTQRRAVETLVSDGAVVCYDNEIDEDGRTRWQEETYPAWKQWVMRTFGDEYVVKVRSVSFWVSGGRRGVRPTAESWNAIAHLPDLSALTLDQCDVNDADLAHLRGMTRLGNLVLTENPRITDAGLVHLEGLRHLSHLDLVGTGIGDAGMHHLRNLTRLDSLLLGGTRVGDLGLASFRNMHELRVLHLSLTETGDAGLAHLGGLDQLSQLYADSTHVTDAGLATLGRLRSLETLAVSSDQVSDAGIAHLKDLDQLETLFIDQTRVSDASIPTFEQMPALTLLIAKGSGMTADGVKALELARPTLRVDF